MTTTLHDHVQLHGSNVTRRSFLCQVAATAFAAGTLSLRDIVALQAAELKKQGKHLVVLWMGGGPSQFECFDPKLGTDSAGETKSIKTSVAGIDIAEGWDVTAKAMQDIALIRSMTNKEGSHPRATYQLHTGYAPTGSVKHPAIGCSLAKELADPQFDLPAVVSVGPTIGSAFLGVNFEPFVVDQPGTAPQNTRVTTDSDRYRRRLGVLDQLEGEFAARGGQAVVENHRQLYSKTSKMITSANLKAFQIDDEPQSIKDRYGDSDFGRGCLLARRLIETGVTFVEVNSRGRMGNWDTHQDNFERTRDLIQDVDPGFGTLVADLKERGLLDRTVVLWIGEFGRTPKINPRAGRDHYPRVFNAAIAGGGIKGGQVIGASSKDGSDVKDSPVTPNDLFCTVCEALKVDPAKENMSPLGRPMKIVDGGEVVKKLFG